MREQYVIIMSEAKRYLETQTKMSTIVQYIILKAQNDNNFTA